MPSVASPAMGHWGTCPSPRLSSISFLVYFGVNLRANYTVVCEISWCRCHQLTTLSISTALIIKLLVIEQLLHPALKSTVSAPWHNFHLCRSSQQILATPLPAIQSRLLTQIPTYILLGERRENVNNLPKAVTQQCAIGSWTRDRPLASPTT